MSTLTKQWLKQTIAEYEANRDELPFGLDTNSAIELQAFKLALASLEAEAVYFVEIEDGQDINAGRIEGKNRPDLSLLPDGINHLYAAPPAPVSVPDEVTAEDCPAFVKYDITEVDDAWARGFNACRAAKLQGAEPVTTAYKLRDAVEIIRNSGIAIDAEKILAERDALNAPDCWCHTCRPVTISDMRFVVCPACGNKRCPHANDHRNACTGSNEPGQEGSAYPAAPQQEA